VIDLEKGGGIQGIIDALNRLVYQITIPADKEEGGTYVIPSHGRLLRTSRCSSTISLDAVERMITSEVHRLVRSPPLTWNQTYVPPSSLSAGIVI